MAVAGTLTLRPIDFGAFPATAPGTAPEKCQGRLRAFGNLRTAHATMPNTTSAKKALRKSEVRRLHNRSRRSALRTAVKRCRAAVAAGDTEGIQSTFRQAVKKLDQAAAKGLIHKNAAARTKARLAKLVKEQSAAGA